MLQTYVLNIFKSFKRLGEMCERLDKVFERMTYNVKKVNEISVEKCRQQVVRNNVVLRAFGWVFT